MGRREEAEEYRGAMRDYILANADVTTPEGREECYRAIVDTEQVSYEIENWDRIQRYRRLTGVIRVFDAIAWPEETS